MFKWYYLVCLCHLNCLEAGEKISEAAVTLENFFVCTCMCHKTKKILQDSEISLYSSRDSITKKNTGNHLPLPIHLAIQKHQEITSVVQ